MSTKSTVSVVAVQVQTLLSAMNSQLQLISTAENSKRYAVPSSVEIKYDQLTVEKLQSMNEKLLEIYQELENCIQIEILKPVLGLHKVSPYMVPDNPNIPPMWRSFDKNFQTDLLQRSLYDEVNWLLKNPIPNHVLALFERCFNQEPGTLKDGVAYKLTHVRPITGGTQDIIGTNNITTDVDFLRTLLNFPLDQLRFGRV